MDTIRKSGWFVAKGFMFLPLAALFGIVAGIGLLGAINSILDLNFMGFVLGLGMCIMFGMVAMFAIAKLKEA